MEDTSDSARAASATGFEDRSDAALSLLLGGSLLAATLRLVLYILVASVIAATIATLS